MVHITIELYYQRRLLSLASNRLDHFLSLKYTLAGVKLGSTSFDDVTVTEEDPDVYMVRSHTDPHNHWIVDLQLGECSCPVGYNGTLCKHQLVAATKFMKSTINKIPTDSSKGRQLLAGVALGKDCQLISFYSSLHQSQIKSTCSPSLLIFNGIMKTYGILSKNQPCWMMICSNRKGRKQP